MARGAVLSVVITGVGTALAYPVQILISRSLGAHEYGTYAYALGLLNVAALIVTLDLGGAALRFGGYYHSISNWPLLRGFVRRSRRIVIGTSASAAIGGAALLLFAPINIEPTLAHALLAACALLVPHCLLQLDLNILQAFRRVHEPRIPNLFVRPIGFALFFLAGIHLFSLPRTAATALYSNALGTTVALALSMVLLTRLWPRDERHGTRDCRTAEWLRFSATSISSSFLTLILSQQSDVVVVGAIVGRTEAGLYSAASQLASLVVFGVTTINHFASPLMAAHQDRPSGSALRELVGRITLLNAIVSMPIVAALLVGGRLVLGTFGNDFIAAYPVLVTLVLAQAVSALWGGLWGTLLTMTGFQRDAAVIVVLVAGLNVALTLALTPHMGMIGAALATCIAILTRAVIIALVVRRRLGFWPSVGIQAALHFHRSVE
jgi:O-antigen/teichoic acid export membrane protein